MKNRYNNKEDRYSEDRYSNKNSIHPVIKAEKSEAFIRKLNENKVSQEFLEQCNKVSGLFHTNT